MHNILTRLQNVFGFFTTVATTVAAVIAIIGLLTLPTPELKEGSLQLRNVQVIKGKPYYYSQKREEYAYVRFDLDVDLRKLFTWNTKQVFLYITATYPTHLSSSSSSSLSPTQQIIWDSILLSPRAPAHFNQYIYPSARAAATAALAGTSSKLKNPKREDVERHNRAHPPGLVQLAGQKPKYVITDPSGRLSGRGNVSLELGWSVMPFIGVVTWGGPPVEVWAKDGGAVQRKGGFNPMAVLPGWLRARLVTWRTLSPWTARTWKFEFSEVKEKAQAVKEMGRDGMGMAKGGEVNRLLA